MTTSTHAFEVPAELQPFYKEPTGDDISGISTTHGDWGARLDLARRSALGWAITRKEEHDRAQATRAAADKIQCQVCGHGGAQPTQVAIPRLGGLLAGADRHNVTVHPRCADDLAAAIAERRRTTHRTRVDKLIDSLGIEA